MNEMNRQNEVTLIISMEIMNQNHEKIEMEEMECINSS